MIKIKLEINKKNEPVFKIAVKQEDEKKYIFIRPSFALLQFLSRYIKNHIYYFISFNLSFHYSIIVLAVLSLLYCVLLKLSDVH